MGLFASGQNGAMIGVLFLLMAGAAGSDCRPESFVSLPLTCPSNPWAPPWSCAGTARACWPCRFEFTQEGESAPSQVEAWTFDRDGKLLRYERRIADQVTVVTCEPAAGPGRTVCRRVVPIPPRAQTPSDAVKGGRGGKQKAGPSQVELVEHLELKGRTLRSTQEGGNRVTYTYDSDWRLQREVTEFDDGSPPQTSVYHWSKDGRLASVTEGGRTQKLRYDSDGRYAGWSVIGDDHRSGQTVHWKSRSEVVLESSDTRETFRFDERGRLTTSSLELQPGVVGTHGTGRYLYDCKADPASIP